MNLKKSLTGAMIASAVAVIFAGCATTSTGKTGESSAAVKCAGLNSCKGQSSCAGASNSCKGENACKGQGWVPTDSDKACTDGGGTVLASSY